jgi:hypothetical protein
MFRRAVISRQLPRRSVSHATIGLFNNLIGKLSTAAPEPWTQASIYDFVVMHTDPATGRVESEGEALPDEPAESETQIRWAAGALDGVLGHHGAREDSEATGQRVANLLDRIARTGDQRAIATAYALLKEASMLGLIDPVLDRLGKYRTPFEPHLSRFALQLATQSGPVKLGIALLGAMRLRQHEEIVTTLGKHEEFSLYAASALASMCEDAKERLWSLAGMVSGWGRIHVVERLVPTDDPRIQEWLRREGFRNSVMYEYLALTAAIHGGLREVLQRRQVDVADVLGAGEIICAMITADNGPAFGMNAYSDAAAVCRAYLLHVSKSPPDLVHMEAAQQIIRYIEQDPRDEAECLSRGWNEAARAEVTMLARRYISRNDWGALIREQLSASDIRTFERAARAAQLAGIDAFEWHWQRVNANPCDSGAWLHAMESANSDRIDQLVTLAGRALPLEKIATGPGDKAAAKRELEAHTALELVLQRLKDFPGKGMNLIAAGLRSPVFRNRNLAINALAAAEAAGISSQAKRMLELALNEETNDEIRKRLMVLRQRF